MPGPLRGPHQGSRVDIPSLVATPQTGRRRPVAGRVARLAVMDLHVIGPLASPAERAAVDAVLGPPESGWVGGPRDSSIDGHAARGGHATRARRSQLLPALHAVQSRIGWISTPALNYVCKRLAVAPAEAYGVATFYALFATNPRPPVVAHVCDDIACRLAGAEGLCADLARALGPAGEPIRDGRATWLRSPCLGLCDRAPAVLVTSAGEAADAFTLAPVDAVGVAAALEADRARTGASWAAGRARPDPLARTLRATPGPDRDGRPDLAGCLPGERRLPRPGARDRDRPGCGHRGGHRREADGTRRRRVPDRSQVGRRRDPARPAALPRLQRRRVGARDVQGSRAARGRPVRDGRGDDHRGLRHRRLEGLPLHPRGVPRGRGARDRGDRGGARGRLPRTGHPRLGLRLRHRAPARRRRVHLRRGDGALRIDRGQAGRAAQQAAVPGRGRPVRQADRRQQRRDAGQRAAHRARGRRGVRPDRHRRLDRTEALLPVGPRRAAGRLRGRVRGDAARPDRAGRAACRVAGRSGRSCSAARRASSSARTRSTCRSPSRRPGPPARRSARA